MPSETSSSPKKLPGNPAGNFSGAMVIGSEFVGFGIVGVVLDYFLGNFNTIPWATLILSPMGPVIGMFHLYQLVKPRPKA